MLHDFAMEMFRKVIRNGAQAEWRETKAPKKGSASDVSDGALRSSLVGPIAFGGRDGEGGCEGEHSGQLRAFSREGKGF